MTHVRANHVLAIAAASLAACGLGARGSAIATAQTAGVRPAQTALELIDDVGNVERRFDVGTSAAGGADGDVRAPLLYVNRGDDAAFARLRRNRLSAFGRIVLVRAGSEAPTDLAARARRYGAVGVIVYRDARDAAGSPPVPSVDGASVAHARAPLPILGVGTAIGDALLYASARDVRAHLIVHRARANAPAPEASKGR